MMYSFLEWLKKIDAIGVVKWYNSLTLKKRFEIRTTFIFIALIGIIIFLIWLIVFISLENKRDINLLNDSHSSAIIDLNTNCDEKLDKIEIKNDNLINQMFSDYRELREDLRGMRELKIKEK